MNKKGVNGGQWQLREKILMFSGLTLIASTFIASTFLEKSFHYEFLAAGLGLCGIGVFQWGDRKL